MPELEQPDPRYEAEKRLFGEHRYESRGLLDHDEKLVENLISCLMLGEEEENVSMVGLREQVQIKFKELEQDGRRCNLFSLY